MHRQSCDAHAQSGQALSKIELGSQKPTHVCCCPPKVPITGDWSLNYETPEIIWNACSTLNSKLIARQTQSSLVVVAFTVSERYPIEDSHIWACIQCWAAHWWKLINGFNKIPCGLLKECTWKCNWLHHYSIERKTRYNSIMHSYCLEHIPLTWSEFCIYKPSVLLPAQDHSRKQS